MWLYSVRKQEQGFTLIEMIVTVVILGVIAAAATPNLLGFLNRNEVNQEFAEIEGALREAQKVAIRNGKSCTISIDAAAKTISNDTVNDRCLTATRFINSKYTLDTSRPTITFSGKGNIDITTVPVIVLSFPTGGVTRPKCVVIQNSLGVIRTGTYNGTIPQTPVPGSCVETY